MDDLKVAHFLPCHCLRFQMLHVELDLDKIRVHVQERFYTPRSPCEHRRCSQTFGTGYLVGFYMHEHRYIGVNYLCSLRDSSQSLYIIFQPLNDIH